MTNKSKNKKPIVLVTGCDATCDGSPQRYSAKLSDGRIVYTGTYRPIHGKPIPDGRILDTLEFPNKQTNQST